MKINNTKRYKPLKKRRRKNLNKKAKKLILFIFITILILLLLYMILNVIIFKKKISFKKIIPNSHKAFSNNKTKVCLCTPARKENRYIREFIQHYENYGVDKIFLYDNNDINGENFDEILKDYISNGFVEVLNWRGKYDCMYKIMNNCYKNNYKTYDWLIFYEVDEFIHLNNFTNVKDFLDEDKFKKCEIIHLNLLCHTDNNQLYYENKPVAERFPEITPKDRLGGKRLETKCIIRGNLPFVNITNIHRGDEKLKNCNGYGHGNSYNYIFARENDYTNYYIDHYYSKSTEELIEKVLKGDNIMDKDGYNIHRIKKYFTQSIITQEKLDLIEKRTGLKFPELRNKTILAYLPV